MYMIIKKNTAINPLIFAYQTSVNSNKIIEEEKGGKRTGERRDGNGREEERWKREVREEEGRRRYSSWVCYPVENHKEGTNASTEESENHGNGEQRSNKTVTSKNVCNKSCKSVIVKIINK
jgi:hypothetical protein